MSSALSRRSQTLRIRNYPDIAIVIMHWCRLSFGMLRYRQWGGYLEEGMANLIRDYFDAVLYRSGNSLIQQTKKDSSSKKSSTISSEINCVVISHDGIHLYLGRSDSPLIEQWDLNLQTKVHEWRAHSGEVCSVDFSRSPTNITQDILVSGGRDRFIRVWEAYSHRCRLFLEGHRGWVTCVKFDESGQLLVSGSHDQSVRVWSVKSGSCLSVLVGHCGKISDVGIIHCGGIVISCAFDDSVRVWDRRLQTCLGRTREETAPLKLAYNRDESILVSCSGEVRSLPELQDLFKLKRGSTSSSSSSSSTIRGTCVAINPVRNELLGLGLADTWEVQIFDLYRNCRVLKLHGEGHGHSSKVTGLQFTPNGRRLISVSRDESIRMWDCSSLIDTDE